MNSTRPVTRLAPSPTGALHLGNARTFMLNWVLAQQLGWGLILRIEDLETPRTKDGADKQAIDDLRWLGMNWEDGPFYQLADLSPYASALKRLADAGLSYRCAATRSEIEQAQSAPHGDDHERRYPGIYRPQPGKPIELPPDRPVAWRVVVPDESIGFVDEVGGPQSFNVQRQVGDFVVATKAGLPAYQLAVVVDDARQGVTDVVRGDDLLRSTARQVLLYRLLELGPPPRYWHVPLVLGEDGRRLAKRHGDTRIAFYRERGVRPERLIGLLAAWSGLCDTPEPMTADQFALDFRLDHLPREPVVFTQADHRWLMGG